MRSWRLLRPKLSKAFFAAGDVIIEKGTHSSGMYVVLKGTAHVQFPRGEIQLDIDTLTPGDVFGEIGFSNRDVERSANVIAAIPNSAT